LKTIHSYVSAWKPYIHISQHGNHTFLYFSMETYSFIYLSLKTIPIHISPLENHTHSYIAAWKPYLFIYGSLKTIPIHISQLENQTHSYMAAWKPYPFIYRSLKTIPIHIWQLENHTHSHGKHPHSYVFQCFFFWSPKPWHISKGEHVRDLCCKKP
jgi:hypothetical protein